VKFDRIVRARSTAAAVAAAFSAFLLFGLGAHRAEAKAGEDGVFVMGIDGMDPVILSRMIEEGKMPNFAGLAKEGSFQSLGTSNPPQSPVAWSNFVTGMNPGGHGIFDFMHRDTETYAPISSATAVVEDDVVALRLFGYVIPISGGEMSNNRGGTPFWDVLRDDGVDVEVYRIPGNYPTPPSEAKVLSGMGVTDLRGGYGTYTLYTDTLVGKNDPKGDVQVVTVRDLDLDGTPDTASGVLRGPPDQLRLEPGQIPKESQYLSQSVTIHVDPETNTAVVDVAGTPVVIEQGEWSDWVEVTWDMAPLGMMPVTGTVRFYARELRPSLQVYASPVNIAPSAPLAPVTSPDDFIESLYGELGSFYTQGMPEEVDALKDGIFDDDDYAKQVKLVQDDTLAMLDLALGRFEKGDTTFVYFSDIDLQCHMLWRHGDPKHPGAPPHPAFEPKSAEAHRYDVEGYYRDVDAALGKIRSRLPEGTLLMVMSDHGFQPFSRDFHLNAWLRDNGYLAMKEGKRTGYTVTGDVDWSKTRAFGIGFNGLYLNQKDRESEGIVDPKDAGALMDEIARNLEDYRDPKTGDHVVLEAFRSKDVYSGERVSEAPDMLIGYDRGYGASDESALGEITEGIIADNESRWSGNHLMAPQVVPGVLLINRKLSRDGHDLTDLTATLLSHYGIRRLPDMTGEPIL
jgi:predicted AlkP superfamily phosphohydrolase/phosphomutase